VSGKRGRGTKRSPAHPWRAGWSAAQAAYLAVQLRDELLARYPDNPLVLHLEAGTREDVIGQWVQVYRRAGLRKAEALRRGALQSGHTAPFDKGMTVAWLAESVMREAILGRAPHCSARSCTWSPRRCTRSPPRGAAVARRARAGSAANPVDRTPAGAAAKAHARRVGRRSRL
jgi:hypothetical protein